MSQAVRSLSEMRSPLKMPTAHDLLQLLTHPTGMDVAAEDILFPVFDSSAAKRP